MMPANEIFTLGHSNRSLENLLSLVRGFNLQALVDIRRFPSSRKFPYFNAGQLRTELEQVGVVYFWLEALGGRRGKTTGGPSPNQGLENPAFRHYADHMATAEFGEGIEELLQIARDQRTGVMCAEKLFWNCHRRLLGDFLQSRGISVQHIFDPGRLRPHRLTPGAVWNGRTVRYPLPLLAAATGDESEDS